MSLAFAQHLQDFGSSTPVVQPPVFNEPVMSDSPQIDISAELEAAKQAGYQEGFAAAIQEAQSAKQAELDGLNQAHGQQLQTLEQELGSALADKMAQDLSEKIDQSVRQLCLQINELLGQVFEEEIVKKSILQLENVLADAFSNKDISTICVSAPKEILDKIEGLVADKYDNIQFTQAPHPEINVELDTTVFSSRLLDFRNILMGQNNE